MGDGTTLDKLTSARIAQANGRLRSGNVGVTIKQHRNRLYLRGTFPAKDGGLPQQQMIATGIHANPQGVSAAEKEARRVGALLDSGEFRWEEFARQTKARPPLTVGEWIDRAERDYFSRRDRNPKSETTWAGDYLKVYRRLPADEPLTIELIHAAIAATPPDTKTRKRACFALGKLAELAGIPLDLPSSMPGNYSPRRVTPRDLPTDETIAAFFQVIPNRAWRWVYGMLAAYGLRPHEVFHLDLGDMPVIHVLDGKTGARRVWPCYPEWVEQFDLVDRRLPTIDLNRDNSKIGWSCNHGLKRYGLPFKPYDLRHCWAIRTIEFGLPIELAAQQMGHSLKVHSETYHHWISSRHHQRAFELLMQRPDRPLPPKF